MISQYEFTQLKRAAFDSDNAGYNADVIEAPNGDGTWDYQKRYAHIAPKYGFHSDVLLHAYIQAFNEAKRAMSYLNLTYRVGLDSTLRVLEYPPGATSAPHTDFCLFTLSLYRSDLDAFKYGRWSTPSVQVQKLFPRIHFGELLTELVGGPPATLHEVTATAHVQHAAVFFVMPPLSTTLPNGLTVAHWLDERKERSRKGNTQ